MTLDVHINATVARDDISYAAGGGLDYASHRTVYEYEYHYIAVLGDLFGECPRAATSI